MRRSVVSLFSIFVLFAGTIPGMSVKASIDSVPPGTDPVAGPIEVFATVSSATVVPGGLGSAEIVVVNSDENHRVRVALRASIVFADGKRKRLGVPSTVLLDPESALAIPILFVVPPGAALGTAKLSATAYAGRITGSGSKAAFGAPLIAHDADTFDVVAP